jgi:hypothetical protein
MPRRDGAPRRALGSKGPLEGHQAIHVRYRDSSPLKTISPCLILRTLGTEALHSSGPLCLRLRGPPQSLTPLRWGLKMSYDISEKERL